MYSKLLAVGLSFWVLGCTQKMNIEESRWNGEGVKPSLEDRGLSWQNEVHSMHETIQFSEQKFEGIPIRNAFAKVISSPSGRVMFQSYSLAKEPSSFGGKGVLIEAHQLERLKGPIWQIFLLRNPQFKSKKIESGPHVILVAENELLPALSVIVSESSGELTELIVTKTGKLFQAQRRGSQFNLIQTPALAFPKGPKKSDLSQVFLNRIAQPEGLLNFQVEVTTQSPDKILESQDLNLPPTDERFDQIQAFYFANQILDWLKLKGVLDSTLKIGIVTQMGFPEKTNTAFYFQKQIRLGSGDDVTFSKIPWDPSIVMHETSHAVIDMLAQLPTQGEGGSINEGYADCLTSFFLGNPNMGENAYLAGPYKRTVDQTMKLSQRNGGLYHDSAVVSGFFWSLRKTIDADKALSFAVRTLHRLGPNSTFQDFMISLKEMSDESFQGEERVKVQSLMRERELL